MSAAYFFFFNDTATTEIYTLSLHDALPISPGPVLDDQRTADHGVDAHVAVVADQHVDAADGTGHLGERAPGGAAGPDRRGAEGGQDDHDVRALSAQPLCRGIDQRDRVAAPKGAGAGGR